MTDVEKIEEKIYNIPNLLSFYRIIISPFILYLGISGQEKLFAIFLIISLITDILDGLIARKFNLQTEFGARMDSIADICTYILAIVGIILFKAGDIEKHLFSACVFIAFVFLPDVFCLARFKRLPSFHLYSWKIGGYIQGTFFAVLFAFGFYSAFYYITIIWGILASCEHIAIQLVINELRSNVKGLYWVLKDMKR
ncbi:MAG: CDP-alcohol phosphatidyltransferase family protein [Rhodanobacter sp.]|nr:CDP-alcohol phosphatidyltransferase family protein [Rhodanobacter sp.]